MDYSDFLPAALTLAQRFFAAAEILALPAALIFRLLTGALAAGLVPLIFAHRAL
jgi:predicted solute-binding protein